MASRRRIRRLFLSAIAGVIAFFATVHFFPKPLPELSREELIAEVKGGYVHEVVITDEVLTAVSSRRGKFRVALQRDDHTIRERFAELRRDREPVLDIESVVVEPVQGSHEPQIVPNPLRKSLGERMVLHRQCYVMAKQV